MDWNGNPLRPPPFLPRPETSLNFLYNNNYHEQYPSGLEMRYPVVMGQSPSLSSQGLVGNRTGSGYNNSNVDQKKKRLTNEQLESLENSFQEEIKLEPDRKMRLARDLGMQPRQVAIWFQNRRARWKSKQIERLYDNLKLQYDNVSREKQKLQEEVMKLRAMMKEDRAAMNNKQVSRGYTEMSGEETVDSTSVGNRSSCKATDAEGTTSHHNQHQQIGMNGVDQGTNYVFNVDDYNHQVEVVPPNYWTATHALPPNFP